MFGFKEFERKGKKEEVKVDLERERKEIIFNVRFEGKLGSKFQRK